MKKSDEYEYDLIYYDNKRLEQTDAYGYTTERKQAGLTDMAVG